MLKLRILTWNINNEQQAVSEVIRYKLHSHISKSPSSFQGTKESLAKKNIDCHNLWIFCFQETPLLYKLPYDLLSGTDLTFYHKQNCSLLTIFVYNKNNLELDINSFFLAMAPSLLWKGGVLHFIRLRCSGTVKYSKESLDDCSELIYDKISDQKTHKNNFYSFILANLHLAAHIHNHELRIIQIEKLILLLYQIVIPLEKDSWLERIFLAGDFNTRSILEKRSFGVDTILNDSIFNNYFDPILQNDDPNTLLSYTETKDLQMNSIKSIFNFHEWSIQFKPTFKLSRSNMVRTDSNNRSATLKLGKYILKLPFIVIFRQIFFIKIFCAKIKRLKAYLFGSYTSDFLENESDSNISDSRSKEKPRYSTIFASQAKDETFNWMDKKDMADWNTSESNFLKNTTYSNLSHLNNVCCTEKIPHCMKKTVHCPRKSPYCIEERADIIKKTFATDNNTSHQLKCDEMMKNYSVQHIPSWCDRILFRMRENSEIVGFKGETTDKGPRKKDSYDRIDKYNSLNTRTSDHLPVFARFRLMSDKDNDQHYTVKVTKLFFHLLMRQSFLLLHLSGSFILCLCIRNLRIIILLLISTSFVLLCLFCFSSEI